MRLEAHRRRSTQVAWQRRSRETWRCPQARVNEDPELRASPAWLGNESSSGPPRWSRDRADDASEPHGGIGLEASTWS
jgi:hypothetical protein